ncbi:MAG: hypothetical protein KTR26_16340 [Flammeovirgaceae bacterium]|nr:hypothetical protein [Flammeovirgaceae bacterium]
MNPIQPRFISCFNLKKICLIIFSLFLATGFATAQRVNTQWGPTQKKIKKHALISDIVDSNELGVFAIMEADPGFFSTSIFSFSSPKPAMLQLYDEKMMLKKAVPIENRIGNEFLVFLFAQSMNGKIFTFSSQPSQQARKNFLFVQEFDMETMKSEGPPKKIAESGLKNRNNFGEYSSELSRDRSKFMIWNSEVYVRGENEKFSIQVFDEKMEELWQKNITIPYSDKLFEIDNYRVDNRGNAYILGVEYKGKLKERRRGKPNYQYKILSYKSKGDDFQEYTVSLKDKFITDLNFRINDDGDIICAGFYSEKGTTSIKGTCFLKIDAQSKKIVKQGFNEFDNKFLSEFMSYRKANKGDKELYRYNIDHIILRSDGGALLVAEQFYVRVYSSYDQRTGMTDYTYYYYYNDIIVLNINPDMSIEWATRIPKRQKTANDGGYFSSYVHGIQGGKIHFIYNDNIKNIKNNNPNSTAYFNGKKSVVVLASVDKEGQMKRRLVSSNRAENIICRPKSCEQITDNEILIYGEKRKSYKLGLVELD